MRHESARDQADSSGKQHEHRYCVEKTGRLKIDLQIRNNARKNNDDTGKQQKPADNGLTVEEQNADAEDERHKRQSESIEAKY